jgi:AcrR family transcriptional regulator
MEGILPTKKKKLTARALQAKKTKCKLSKNAMELIDKYGYDNVTIADISQMTGVSVGAFYHYYSSKAEIFAEFYKQIDSFFENNVTPLLNQPKVLDNIIMYFCYYAKYISDKGIRHSRFLFETQNKVFVDKSRYMYVYFKQIILEGQNKGQLTDTCDAEFIEDFLLVLARGVIYDWNLKEGSFDLIDRMRRYMEISCPIFSANNDLSHLLKSSKMRLVNL